jgi:hypothetical protein
MTGNLLITGLPPDIQHILHTHRCRLESCPRSMNGNLCRRHACLKIALTSSIECPPSSTDLQRARGL